MFSMSEVGIKKEKRDVEKEELWSVGKMFYLQQDKMGLSPRIYASKKITLGNFD